MPSRRMIRRESTAVDQSDVDVKFLPTSLGTRFIAHGSVVTQRGGWKCVCVCRYSTQYCTVPLQKQANARVRESFGVA